ncbi:MAG: ribbon-helix-helix protein, CopG family [Planctomycetota bacterium]
MPIKTTVYLDKADYRRLKAIARLRKRSAAEMIREAIANFARQFGRRPRSVGAGRSGRGDLSERAEELLRGIGKR